MSFTLIRSWVVLDQPYNFFPVAWLHLIEQSHTPPAASSMAKLAPCTQARLRQHHVLVAALLLSAFVSIPTAPAMAANSCWFGDPASRPAALPDCSDPAFSFVLIDRFYLHILTLPTQGAGTIDFALTSSDEFMAVDVSFIPPLEIPSTGSPLSGAFNYQLSIDPFDTDYFFSARLAITPPPANPPSEPAALTLVQQIPEADLSLNVSDASPVSLYREPDPLKSITLLGQFTLQSGSLNSIHNGFDIFVYEPPQRVPAPLPLFGAGMAFGYSRRLRRRLSLGR